MNEKDGEMLFMELSLRVRMRREFEDRLGKVKYSMTVREDHIGINFPINSDFLYVATESNVDLTSLPTTIIKIINNQKKESRVINAELKKMIRIKFHYLNKLVKHDQFLKYN